MLKKSRQRSRGRFLPDTEAGAVMKSPGAALFLKLRPNFPNPEAFVPNVDIVKQEDAARPKFRQPRVQIVANGGFGMKAVEMEKVDTLVCELRQSVIEAGAEQGRECFVIRAIMLGDLAESCLVVAAGMFVALPTVDPKAARAGSVFQGRLTEREIALAAIDPQLHEQHRS